jgi:hypothetical protein
MRRLADPPAGVHRQNIRLKIAGDSFHTGDAWDDVVSREWKHAARLVWEGACRQMLRTAIENDLPKKFQPGRWAIASGRN